ncbi:MAG: class I SAM-dependent methyltransferase [Nitrospirales bacterium]|nr:methyltransferase domain-containing protein [Nitrospira sp.]MDR4502636.1 class I SAM-dependent methyltransferase [Nitrospirales bacterium]
MTLKSVQLETKEPANQFQIDSYHSRGPVQMGPWTSHMWRDDPRHLGFLLARYKFCAKILSGRKKVLEIGCGDAFGISVVKQTVLEIHGIDLEPLVLEDAKNRLQDEEQGGITLSVHDMTAATMNQQFDAAYSLDVIEHIPFLHENKFMENLSASLSEHSICILGTPNITASRYASRFAAEGHINLKSSETLYELMSSYFHHCLLFSMNDEVVHTGFYPMAHYLLAVGIELKQREI